MHNHGDNKAVLLNMEKGSEIHNFIENSPYFYFYCPNLMCFFVILPAHLKIYLVSAKLKNKK